MGFWLGAGLVIGGGILCVMSVIPLFADPIYDIEGNCYKCGDLGFQFLVAQLAASLMMTSLGVVLMWKDNNKLEKRELGYS